MPRYQPQLFQLGDLAAYRRVVASCELRQFNYPQRTTTLDSYQKRKKHLVNLNTRLFDQEGVSVRLVEQANQVNQDFVELTQLLIDRCMMHIIIDSVQSLDELCA